MAYRWKHLFADLVLAVVYAALLAQAFGWSASHPMPWHPLQGKPVLEVRMLLLSEQLVVVIVCALPLLLVMRWITPCWLRTRALLVAAALSLWMLLPATASISSLSVLMAASYPLVHGLLASCLRPRPYFCHRTPAPPPRYVPPI